MIKTECFGPKWEELPLATALLTFTRHGMGILRQVLDFDFLSLIDDNILFGTVVNTRANLNAHDNGVCRGDVWK